MHPLWHFRISSISLVIYVIVTRTPPDCLWLSIGIISGVLIDVDHFLHVFIFQPVLTMNYLKRLDFIELYRELKEGHVFDSVWLYHNKWLISWKSLLYYSFVHGIFILFVFLISPHLFMNWYIPIRISIVIHYLSDISFGIYTTIRVLSK